MTSDKKMSDPKVLCVENFDFVRFTIADIHGIARTKLVTGRNAASVLQDGMSLYGSVMCRGPFKEMGWVPEPYRVSRGNAQLQVDASTLHNVPWAGDGRYNVGEYFCESLYMDGNPHQACPRFVAKKVIAQLEDLHLTPKSGFEMEFVLKEKSTGKPLFNKLYNLSGLVLSRIEPFFLDLDTALNNAGVDVQCFHMETLPGQAEAVLNPTLGIDSADSVFMFKHAIKEMAQNRGMLASFISKSKLLDDTSLCNNMHFNVSLLKRKEDGKFQQIFNGKDEHGFSEEGKHFLAGLLVHANALTALLNPTVNCYRGLNVKGRPKAADWSFNARNTAFDVKHKNKSAYIEIRMVSGLANPYLVMAGALAAGLDGLKRKLDCPTEGGKNEPALPKNLEEALAALESDDIMVESLSKEFVDWFISVKRGTELKVLAPLANNDLQSECEMYEELF